VEIDIQLVIV